MKKQFTTIGGTKKLFEAVGGAASLCRAHPQTSTNFERPHKMTGVPYQNKSCQNLLVTGDQPVLTAGDIK
jgi:hypothetical protein